MPPGRESAEHDLVWVLKDLSDWRMLADRLPDDPLDTIIQELRLFGLPEDRWEGYLEQLALEIPGWSGMALWRHNHPGYGAMSTPVDMMDYLAVRLVMERLFAQRLCRRNWRIEATLSALRWYFRHLPAELVVRHALFEGRLPEYLISFAEQLTREAPNRKENIHDEGWQTMAQLLWSWQQTPAGDRRGGVSVSGSAWPLFCLAQHLGLAGSDITAMGRTGADALLDSLTLLDADQRGHVWLLAYERNYREQIFTALKANHGSRPLADPRPPARGPAGVLHGRPRGRPAPPCGRSQSAARNPGRSRALRHFHELARTGRQRSGAAVPGRPAWSSSRP